MKRLLNLLIALLVLMTAAMSANAATVLMWNAPTTNTDGTPLTDLGGFKIHYGHSSGSYTDIVDVGNVTTHTLNLPDGHYCFVATAYDDSRNESSYSNEACKDIDTNAPSAPISLRFN